MDDHIKVRGLSLTASLSESPWTTVDPSEKPVLQPITVSLDVHHDIRHAGTSDDLTKSVDYSAICKSAQDACLANQNPQVAAPTAYALAQRILRQCLSGINLPISQLDVELELPKAVLRANSACVRISRRKDGSLVGKQRFLIRDLPVHTIVGIHPREREDKQPVILTLEFSHAADLLDRLFKFNFAKLERSISDFVESSAFLTVEALTSEIAKKCFSWLEDPRLYTVTVSLAKPAALRMADAPEISITRSLSDFPSLEVLPFNKPTGGKILATLALGANLGDRFQNIESALRYLENFKAISPVDASSGEIDVVDTSFLYETAPMYVVSQPAFINCACLVETTLSAHDLLRVCKLIEKAVGRVPSVRYGPRAVDLDIITYDNQVIDTRSEGERNSLDNLEGHLVIPHPRMAEREFVLRPLNDIIPEWVHPKLNLSIRSLFSMFLLVTKPAGELPMHKVMPFPCPPNVHPSANLNAPPTQTYWVLPDPHAAPPPSGTPTRRTYVMATLNFTPDSFSDGAQHNTLATAFEYARAAVAAGADIIDVGGYSTRPGAAFVSTADEIARIVPAIQAIRAAEDEALRDVLISVDTFREEVARAAVAAGANCINDVYAFSGQQYPATEDAEGHFARMRAAVRELGVPAILMHSRGEAGANKDYSMYASPETPGSGKPVLEGVRAELGAKVARATKGKGGLRRWQVMVDPGIGFSKTVEGNLEVLRDASSLTVDAALTTFVSFAPLICTASALATPQWNPLAGYPILIGTSRKSYLEPIVTRPLLPANAEVAVKESKAPVARLAKERDFATAAAVACAVQQGAAVVRVHEVQGLVDVVKVSAALWC